MKVQGLLFLSLFIFVNGSTLRAQIKNSLMDYVQTVYEASYGKMLSCPENEAVTQLCSSGKNADCNDYYTNMICNSFDIDESVAIDVLDGQSWGEWVDCSTSGDNEVLVGICTSGEHKDCDDHPLQAQCQPLESPYYLSPVTEVKCCKHGEMCSCQSGYAITSVCTSGENDDCKSSHCSSGDDTYTGIICTQVETVQAVTYSGYYIGLVNGETTYSTTITYSDTASESETTEESANMEMSASLSDTESDGFCKMTTKFGIDFSAAYSESEQSSLEQTVSASVTVDCTPPDFTERYSQLDEAMGEPAGYYSDYNTEMYQWFYDASDTNGPLATIPKCLFIRQPQGTPPPQCPYDSCMDTLCQTCCLDSDGNFDYASECNTTD